MRLYMPSGALAIVLAAGTLGGTAHAGAIPHLHIKGHLRVDGSSDLRGKVRARSGLAVTNGLATDSLATTGPVQVGGTLSVAGVATVAGLNAGAGSVVTTGALQGGSLAISGDATLGGNVSVAKALTAASAGISGNLTAGTGQFNAVSAGTIAASGTVSGSGITGSTGTFSQLAVNPGGTVNFNNAAVTGLSGSSFAGSGLTLQSLNLTTSAVGGSGGTQALTISQAGQASSLSVSSTDNLVVTGNGLVTPSLTVTKDASIGGTLSVAHIVAPSSLLLDSPNVTTTGNLNVAAGKTLVLSASSGNNAHILGNHDTGGSCTSAAVTTGVNTCSIAFNNAYGTVPTVVASPAGADPTEVTGFSVQAGASGFTIYYTVKANGSVTFHYLVEG